jgi:hypothetical protein
MTGDSNSYHRLSLEEKVRSHEKQSLTMKKKIVTGEFTPNTNNYRTHKMLSFNFHGVTRKVRSVWELIWWALHPTFGYEELRLPYTINEESHIYIVDFVDHASRTVYELKPKKYQTGLIFEAKKKSLYQWAASNQFDVQYISEEYFQKLGRLEMIDILNKLDMPDEDRKTAIRRVRWYKNESC